MKIPAITGVIRRRLLLNYRLAPEVVSALLPAGFRPKLVGSCAIAGICLIRLEKIRPKGMPDLVGLSSENSAHRIAVEWSDQDGKTREGVFIPRRDTNSLLNTLAGGRVFPGVHHHSLFSVEDREGRISIGISARGTRERLLEVVASETDIFPADSAFHSLKHASAFFESGCVGYSARPDSCLLDGLTLKVRDWKVSPLEIHSLSSSYYDDDAIFPAGSAEFDHGLIMRDVTHEWHSEPMIDSNSENPVEISPQRSTHGPPHP